MKSPRTSRRPLFLLPALAAILAGSQASAAFVIAETNGLFDPSFRGAANTTYFGWANGTWDGNADSTPPDPVIPDVISGTPSINPGSLAGSSFLTQSGTNDVVSGSNNIYSSVAGITAAGLQLIIPTSGVVGSAGFTTIIIQGVGLNGAGFGGTSGLDGFGFGAIKGLIIAVIAFSLVVLGYDAVWGPQGRPLWITEARSYPFINAGSEAMVQLIHERREQLRDEDKAIDGEA